MDTEGKFYLGRFFDIQAKKTTQEPLLYDPDDLTTHAVVVGMTGSGKTGLCVGLLEEAALNQIPALMIDPKGDITNMLLHFPDLLPADFQPWVNADEARREGKSLAQAAADTAAMWKKGLSEWGIEPERIKALQEAADYAIYTPGSDAGIPINILNSLKAPDLPWEGNRELLREKISGTVTALLGLVGMQDIDPVRSREHILLSNIFEYAWSQGHDLELSDLILQAQNPPFSKLGVFDVNAFFPEKERFELSILLNNILAAPAFQTWIMGQPLDIPSLLYSADGKPRHSVFYVAHLNDSERMFFITLLYSTIESWMRTQTGTSTLRAIVYFDEIFGYMPPLNNPPSKIVMLRMLKQARAFGVGQVLVTQNPVDLDYKGLSNTGTWFIGKLQTERDKIRLLDGLEGAAAGSMDRGEYDQLLSALGKRVFLLHNVHASRPSLFQTRWAMNYLAGPLARTQIPELNRLTGAVQQETPPQTSTARGKPASHPGGVTTSGVTQQTRPADATKPSAVTGLTTRQTPPAGVNEYFLPSKLSLSQAFKLANQPYPAQPERPEILYRPTLLAQASVRFLNRKYDLDYELVLTALVEQPDRRGAVRWEDYPYEQIDSRQLESQPEPKARFSALEAPLSDARLLNNMEKDFVDWVFRSGQITLRSNEALHVFAGPNITEGEFRERCAEAARKERDKEVQATQSVIEKKIDALKLKIAKEERELEQDKTEASQRKLEEWGTYGETLLGMLGGRRKRSITSSMSKRRMSAQAKADVKESEETIKSLREQIAELETNLVDTVKEVNDKWSKVASQIDETTLSALKKDILVDIFGVAWFPYYMIEVEGQSLELPAYGNA